jgi:hypothetical protein
LDEFITSHGLLASWMEVLTMASDKGGHWSLWVGKLWDVALEGSFESVPVEDRGIQISRVEV